jgi:hypothetical protein
MSFLLEQGLYDSAELLGCFLMCATTANSEILPSVRAENMVLLADALYGKKEYRRALNMYRQALQQCRVSPKQAMGGTRTPVQSRLPAVNLTHFSNINENEVQCCSCQSLRGVLGIGLRVKLLIFFFYSLNSNCVFLSSDPELIECVWCLLYIHYR